MSGSNTTRAEVALMMQQAQDGFLLQGGLYAGPLQRLRAAGLLQEPGVYVEYPKMLYIATGEVREVVLSTEDVKGKLVTWNEFQPVINEVLVHSEEEEDRVRNGGKTAAQIEEDRQAAISQIKARGLRYDPTWSLLRLQKEMGIAPAEDQKVSTQFDEVENLREQVRKAEEAIALRAKLKELQAQLVEAEHSEESAMRRELTELGVRVDGRWSAARLREEYERATSPG